MTNFKNIRPKIVASRCLGFEKCRWNGETIPSEYVEALKPFVEYFTTCPEVEIGLGVPRKPIRIVNDSGKTILYQPSTGLDCTEKMLNFCAKFLSSLKDIDGFILKFRSPSCGMKAVKIYSSREPKAASFASSAGFFGGEVLRRFPFLAIEDEGRLNNTELREYFYTKIFALAKFREVKGTKKSRSLVEFHSQNKLLFMAYSEVAMRQMGKTVANLEKLPIEEVFENYHALLYKALAKPPKLTACVNVLQHGFGFFKTKLKAEEKKYFLDLLKKYKSKKLPLSTVLGVLRSYAVRFDEKYLLEQTFFEPYPEELVVATE